VVVSKEIPRDNFFETIASGGKFSAVFLVSPSLEMFPLGTGFPMWDYVKKFKKVEIEELPLYF
jgi:hypothetical protein